MLKKSFFFSKNALFSTLGKTKKNGEKKKKMKIESRK